MTDVKGALDSVLQGMWACMEREESELLASVRDQPFIASALRYAEEGDVERFNLLFQYPLRKLERAIAQATCKNRNAQFLLLHSQFVERHFKQLFERLEGPACCADKSRTVLRALLRFYRTGERIEFNYDGEVTYHLPQRIFRSHDEIVAFAGALEGLYYGDPREYLQRLNRVITDR